MSAKGGQRPSRPIEVGQLLREELEGEVSSRERQWEGFSSLVWKQIDAAAAVEETSRVAVGELLREELDEELGSREGDWDSFASLMWSRIGDEERRSARVSVIELLNEETAVELDRRDGAWNAFTAGVFRQIDSRERDLARASLEARAVDALRSEIDGELQSMAPSFEERFRDHVEQRIWDAARARPSWWERLTHGLFAFLASLFRPEAHGRRFGLAAAAAAVAVIAVLGIVPRPGMDTRTLPGPASAGEVSIQSVSFEGTVMVMPSDGLTVVWLTDVAS